MSLTPQQSTEINIYYFVYTSGSGLALEPQQSHDAGSSHSNLHHSQSLLPFGNIELLVITILILSLPIMIYLAYRYGKKMGRKETNSPNLASHYFGNQQSKKNSEEGSTCSTSDRGRTQDQDKCGSTDSSPSLDGLSHQGSFRDDSNQIPEPEISFTKEDTPQNQLALREDKETLGQFTLHYAHEDGNGAQNQGAQEMFDEKVKLHTSDEQIEKRHGTFGVRFEKKNGQLHKVETTQVRIIYNSGTPEPEENAKRMTSNFYQTAPIFNRISGPTHAASFPGTDPTTENSGSSQQVVPFLQKTRSDTTNGISAKLVQLALPYRQTPDLVSDIIEEESKKDDKEENKEHRDSKESKENKESKDLSGGSGGDLIKSTKDSTQELERYNSVQKLVEEYDLPDETGKFNKIFKQAELIGEGSFGSVYKVHHRVDGKIYAVKKVKLKLGRFEDMLKESKVFREVFAMTDLNHPHIVRYSTCWVEVELEKDCNETCQNEEKKNTGRKLSLEDISEDEDSVSQSLSQSRTQTQDYEIEEESNNDLFEFAKSSDAGFEFDRGSEDPKQRKYANKQSRGGKKKEYKKSNFGFKAMSSASKDESEDASASEQSKSMMSNYSMTRIDPKFSGCKLYLYIQMEYCPGLSLRTYLDNPKREISRPAMLAMFRKLLEGVKVIHSQGILHRDLKPANIFLDDNNNVKIGDFGLASLENGDEPAEKHHGHVSYKKGDRMHSMKIGTPMYTSPEQESGGHYDQKTDIYSLGLILCEMLQLFGTQHERYQFLNRIRTKHELPGEFSRKYPGESDLIIKMTEKSPNLRPNAEQLIVEFENLLEETRTQGEN